MTIGPDDELFTTDISALVKLGLKTSSGMAIKFATGSKMAIKRTSFDYRNHLAVYFQTQVAVVDFKKIAAVIQAEIKAVYTGMLHLQFE